MIKNKKNIERCTKETTGTISNIGSASGQHKIEITFSVNGLEYKFKEIVMMSTESESIKLWIIPIGRKRKAMIGSYEVGKELRVMYDPNDPNYAYLPDNDNGHWYNIS